MTGRGKRDAAGEPADEPSPADGRGDLGGSPAPPPPPAASFPAPALGLTCAPLDAVLTVLPGEGGWARSHQKRFACVRFAFEVWSCAGGCVVASFCVGAREGAVYGEAAGD